MADKILTENKKALFDSTVLQKWQAGIKLTGPEVKSAKAGQINLKGSFVSVKPDKTTGNPLAWLIGAAISKYAKAGYAQNNYKIDRPRKLLLTQRELNSIYGQAQQKGLTILPLSVYTSRGLVKLEIALIKGKRKFDKREAIKKREFELRKHRLVSN